MTPHCGRSVVQVLVVGRLVVSGPDFPRSVKGGDIGVLRIFMNILRVEALAIKLDVDWSWPAI